MGLEPLIKFSRPAKKQKGFQEAFLLFSFLLYANASLAGTKDSGWKKAYMNLQEGMFASVFSKPGFDWSTCAKDKGPNKCAAVAWPDSDPDTEVLTSGDPIIAETYDPYTESIVKKKFYKVKVSYTRKGFKKEAEGYLDADYISKERFESVYSPKNAVKAEKSAKEKLAKTQKEEERKKPPCPLPKSEKQKQHLKDFVNTVVPSQVETIADEIKNYVGKCALSPGKALPPDHGKNSYDNKAKHLIPDPVPLAILDGNKTKPVSREDVVSIDALARTLYGEMGSCFRKGPQYPMAVARIALNRAEAASIRTQKEFIRGKHNDEDKSDLAKVLTSSSQFNVWMNKGKSKSPLGQALCPPKDPEQKIYNNTYPSSEQLGYWDLAVKISTEAVLFPKKFKEKTSGFNWLFYTSAVDNPNGLEEATTVQKIAGREISAPECIRLWKDNR